MGQPSLPHVTSRNQPASARPANFARRSTFQPATTEACTFAGLWTAQIERSGALEAAGLCRQGGPRGSLRVPNLARAKGRQRAAVGRLGPARPGGRQAPHFACGAGAPPEVPGGGTTFG